MTAFAYCWSHFGTRDDRRFVALIGDAELDEGNVWEAVADPSCRDSATSRGSSTSTASRSTASSRASGSGEFTNVFREHGWHVEILKYGPKLRAAYDLPGGDTLRRRIDDMPNPEYQSLLRRPAGQLRAWWSTAPRAATAARWSACSRTTPTRRCPT